jgi:alpha-L-rhamnosidase
MPHPRGEITVTLQREGTGIVAGVSLPEGVTGTFVWAGKSVVLKAGSQSVRLP